MGFLAHLTVFVLMVHGLSYAAPNPGEHRAPGASEQQLAAAWTGTGHYDQRLAHDRSRRNSLIVGGTLWCGAGDAADTYNDLGVHQKTDMCCRDHDHCPEKINGLSTAFGMFNIFPYTINLCSCDESFRLCLLEANTTVSNGVGHFFFDILSPPCFELTDELTDPPCVRRAWWGKCLEYGPPERTAVSGSNKPYNGD